MPKVVSPGVFRIMMDYEQTQIVTPVPGIMDISNHLVCLLMLRNQQEPRRVNLIHGHGTSIHVYIILHSSTTNEQGICILHTLKKQE